MSGFQRDVSAGWIVSVGCPEGLQARTHPYHHRLEHPKDAQHLNIPPDNTVQWLSVVVSGELSQCQEVSVVASLATCVWGDLCRKLSSPKVFSGPSDTAKNEGPWVKHVIWKWLNAPFLFLQNVAIICHVMSQQLKTLTAWMIFIGPRYTWGPIYGSECLKLTEGGLWNFTELTLADEVTNSILTDNANRAIQGNVTMHVRQPGSQNCNICKCRQLWNQCKWRHMMTKFCHMIAKFSTDAGGTDASSATWWLNL